MTDVQEAAKHVHGREAQPKPPSATNQPTGSGENPSSQSKPQQQGSSGQQSTAGQHSTAGQGGSSNPQPQPQSQNTNSSFQDSSIDLMLSKGLGWFSIALGAVEFLMPGALGRTIGVGTKNSYLPMLGAREIVSGVGILNDPQSPAWLASRVAGDVMDLAYLGCAVSARRSDPVRIAMAAAAVAGVTTLDVLCFQMLRQRQHG